MITGFQFKAARVATKLNAKEIADFIGLHQVTLLRFARTPNLEYLSCHTKNMLLLENFFEKQGILFPTNNCIRLKINESIKRIDYPGLTRFQLVTARIATGLNQYELSQHIRISPGTLSLLEGLENHEFLANRKLKISSLKIFFEHLGILFEDNFTVTLTKDPKTFFVKSKNVN